MTNIYSNLVGRSRFPASSMRAKYFPLEGGENLTDPALSTPPGNLIFGKNYEVFSEGGYRRIDGFERFDGRLKPSESVYYILEFDSGVAAGVKGNAIQGATSGATATLIADAVLESGSYSGSDAVGYMAIAILTGTFQVGENIQVGASVYAVVKTVAKAEQAATDELNSTYAQAAEEEARGLISTVPGSGNLRGVWVYNGTVYAFRDNALGTACVMHKSSSSGWVAMSLGQYIKYDTGVASVNEGDTLTVSGPSSATAVVRRVIKRSGTYGASNAVGLFVVDSVSGTFAKDDVLQVDSSTVATATSGAVTTTLEPGGRYEFINYNFGGSSTTNRMYGCDGKGVAFEFDGTYWVPIFTGMESPPTVTFSGGGGGSGAEATAVLTRTGVVSSVVVDAGGSGYASAPTVTFSEPQSGGVLATGTATVSGGEVTAVSITEGGSSYLTDTPIHISAHKKHLFLSSILQFP